MNFAELLAFISAIGLGVLGYRMGDIAFGLVGAIPGAIGGFLFGMTVGVAFFHWLILGIPMRRSGNQKRQNVRPPIPCPHCGKMLRTGLAKQCFECGADWHNEEN